MKEVLPTWAEVDAVSQKIADNGLVYREDGPEILYLCSVLDALAEKMFPNVEQRDAFILNVLELNHQAYGWDAPNQAHAHEMSVLKMFVTLWRSYPHMARKTWQK